MAQVLSRLVGTVAGSLVIASYGAVPVYFATNAAREALAVGIPMFLGSIMQRYNLQALPTQARTTLTGLFR